MKQQLFLRPISLLLIVATLLQPFAIVFQMQQTMTGWLSSKPVELSPKESDANTTLYMPVISKPVGLPDFEIVAPGAGWTVSGGLFFSAQPRVPMSVTSVTFRAGSTTLGIDNTPQDGFRTFFDANDFPPGPLTLTAVAGGPAGQTTANVTVNVVPNPPSSGIVGANGGVLASEIGSIITIPTGALPDGTQVAVDELSQEEVTAENGIEWEKLGVTFLGAQAIETSAPFSAPYRVASADFGSRVQPGQAVVNYRIIPDADGDGVDEIVVVNTASVAPNDDVISDPIPQILLQPAATLTSRDSASVQALDAGLSGVTGTMVHIRATGLNPASIHGNVGVWRSKVNNQVYELPGSVFDDPSDETLQVFSTIIPPLPPGGATLVIRNESTGSSTAVIDITVEQSPPLTKPAAEVIIDFLDNSILYLQSVPTFSTEQEAAVTESISNLLQAKTKFVELINDGIPPEWVQPLNDFALLTANLSAQLEQQTVAGNRTVVNETRFRDFLSAFGGWAGALRLWATIVTFPVPTPAFVVVITYIALGAALLAGAYFTCRLIRGGDCFGEPAPNRLTVLVPCPSSSGVGNSGTTGMGSAPPPGGSGCGYSYTLDLNQLNETGRSSVGLSPGRFVVKILSGGSTMPFTGLSDAGGYFFIPMIPEGEPFTAIAIDTETGENRITEGIGPPLGEAVFMSFHFDLEGETGTPIAIGDIISGEISEAGESDIYTFSATAGQKVYFDLQPPLGTSAGWRLLDPLGYTVFDLCLACGEPGVKTLNLGGQYTLIVGEASDSDTGPYQFQLWNVPAPDEFNIAIGDVVSDGNPGPGAGNIETPGVEDIYTFNAAAGQVVYFDLQSVLGIGSIRWRLTDANDTVVFDTCLGCAEPGARTLELGGQYTLTVGENDVDQTGTYQFQLWNVPDPDEFAIAIGDVVSNGNPGSGAGNIETPGVEDIYTFNAAAGQVVYFDLQSAVGIGTIRWRLTDANDTVVFDTCLGCAEPGARTLELGGQYTLIIGENDVDQTGTYQYQLWNVPEPDEFTIAIGDVVSNGNPGPGAGNIETPGVEDIYTFNAAAGQVVYFDLQSTLGIGSIRWRLTDANDTVVFDTCLGCAEPGTRTLELGGQYTLIVGENDVDQTGTYQFQLINQSLALGSISLER